MIRRFPKWRTALVSKLNEYRRFPFVWGEHDCALLSADCVLTMTGVDLAQGYRGQYASRNEAIALLAERGFDSHVAVTAAALREIPVGRARVGDVAAVGAGNLLGADMSLALGVVTGETIAVMAPDGLSSLPLSTALRAFEVPF